VLTQRERMLEAVVVAVAEKGYADTTVADVVGRAGVSRRTFYEQFEDKLDCFLAAYEGHAEVLLREIEEAVESTPSGERLAVGLRTYLEHLAARPTFARVLTIDILGAGPRALEVRERIRERFAEHYRGISADEDVQRALVGGIAELVQARLLIGQADRLPELMPTLERFVRAVAGDRGEVLAV
jgi:AcrR family transcriptional regulator